MRHAEVIHEVAIVEARVFEGDGRVLSEKVQGAGFEELPRDGEMSIIRYTQTRTNAATADWMPLEGSVQTRYLLVIGGPIDSPFAWDESLDCATLC